MFLVFTPHRDRRSMQPGVDALMVMPNDFPANPALKLPDGHAYGFH